MKLHQIRAKTLQKIVETEMASRVKRETTWDEYEYPNMVPGPPKEPEHGEGWILEAMAASGGVIFWSWVRYTEAECSYVGRCNSSRCPKHATQPAIEMAFAMNLDRTEGERRILDAMGRVPEQILRDADSMFGPLAPALEDLKLPIRAELARRGLR